jgi:1-acyl-sn-glycerol-3-phosphate acyltransferase
MSKFFHQLVAFIGYNIISPTIYFIFRYILRWKIDGILPDIPKMLVAFAPHTSSIDFLSIPILLVHFTKRPQWLAKKELFKPPFGPLYYDLGGISVDREAPLKATKQIIKYIKTAESVILCLAPEGTRHYTNHWKKGFYFIAHKTKIPIVFIKMNYPARILTIREAFYTTGNMEEDIQLIRPFYADAIGFHPEKASDIQIVSSEN